MNTRQRDTVIAALRLWALLRRDSANELEPAIVDIAESSGAALTPDETDELADLIAGDADECGGAR